MSTSTPDDPNGLHGEHDELVDVRCMTIACRQRYATGKRGFFAQKNRCPRCGSSKAQHLEAAPPTPPPYQEAD